MDDYMTKPVQLEALKAMLAKWLPAPAKVAAERPAQAPPTPAASALALDVSVLKALVGDEPEVINEFLQDFRVSAGQARLQMRKACQDHQAAAIEAVAHRLKSSARSVGALALGELCEELEQAGRAGRLETLADLWSRFEDEMVAVDEFLSSLQE